MLAALIVFVLVLAALVVLVWLTERHHRRTWGDGPQGQEPREPYAPKTWLGQGPG